MRGKSVYKRVVELNVSLLIHGTCSTWSSFIDESIRELVSVSMSSSRRRLRLLISTLCLSFTVDFTRIYVYVYVYVYTC